MTYYIYHITGIKIGCTNQLEKRMRVQGFTEWEILEEHTDIIEASSREIQLQKQYGLPVDKSPYWQSVQNRPKWNDQTRHVFTTEDRIAGGKAIKGTKKPKDWVNNHAFKAALQASLTRIVCEHCDKDANTGNYARWHGDNCKHKKTLTN